MAFGTFLKKAFTKVRDFVKKAAPVAKKVISALAPGAKVVAGMIPGVGGLVSGGISALESIARDGGAIDKVSKGVSDWDSRINALSNGAKVVGGGLSGRRILPDLK